MAVLDDRAVDLRAENAELRRRLEEALAQQQASAEILQLINASPADLAPVFDAMLEKALRLCGAAEGVLRTFDGELFRLVAAKGGYPEELERLQQLGPIRASDAIAAGGPFGRIARGERVVHLADVQATDFYRQHPEEVERVKLRRIRTWLGVTLLKDSVVLGVIVVHRNEVRPFSDKEIALLQNFAAQAVIAMENARLITEMREALEQQTATAEVLGVINASPGDLQPVFDILLDKAMRLCGAAFGAMVVNRADAAQTVATRGVPEAYAEFLRQQRTVPRTPGSIAMRILGGEPFVHTLDLENDDLYRNGDPHRRAVVDLGGARTALVVALKRGRDVLGAFTIYRQEVQPFTEKQIALLQNFAAQAVIAMENARLFGELRERTADLQESLEYQTATSDVLKVISRTEATLEAALETLVGTAARICAADQGAIHQLHDGLHFVSASFGTNSGYRDYIARNPIVPGRGTAIGRMALEGRMVHIEDVLRDPEYTGSEFQRLAGFRTVLAVPLFREDVVIGSILLTRSRVEPFTDKQIELVRTFADQAVIAIENTRLITETREALEQQTATAEVLGVINASPGDLAPVFDAMLEKAMRLCEAAFGELFTFKDGRFLLAALRGVPPRLAEFRRDNPMIGGPGSVTGQLRDGANVVHIVDIVESDAYKAGVPHRRAWFELGGARTVLAVALRKEGSLLGVIQIYRQQVQGFTDKQIALLQNFAAQAVIAMENARLITETREALEQQTATAKVLGVINASPGDLAPVFDAMLDKALHLCDAAHGALYGYDGEAAAPLAVRGGQRVVDSIHECGAFRPAAGPLADVLAGEPLAHVPDARMTEAPELSPRYQNLINLGDIRTNLVVPLRKDDTVLGAIAVYRQEVRPFTDKQIALLQNFAAQAVIAMENARLLGELRQRTEEVAELNRGLEARVAEQVEELGRVGRLKRFLAPQLAELIVSQGDENILESHRREIVVVFCDLRGFTAFAETAEPEEVLDLLREYHAALGPLVGEFEGTLDHFSGDGIMVFFNDPVPCPDPAERAVKMAVAMRAAANELVAAWRRRGRDLGFGVGIAQGYATLGQIGFADRSDYTAIGTVCNLAARLCAEAKDGQILLARRVAGAVEGAVALEELGTLSLKGLAQPVAAFNVRADAPVP